MRIDIVVPCYNEEAALPESARRLLDLLGAMQASGQVAAGSRVLFVDDGSRDDTWRLIRTLAAADERVGGVRLSRNRGHQYRCGPAGRHPRHAGDDWPLPRGL